MLRELEFFYGISMYIILLFVVPISLPSGGMLDVSKKGEGIGAS